MMRHRRGAPVVDASSSSDEEDAFAMLSQKSAKKAKLSSRTKEEADKSDAGGAHGGDGARSTISTTSSGSQKQQVAAMNLPLSNTSSMKRHHGALSDRRKAKMESILLDLQDEQGKIQTAPESSRRRPEQPGRARGSFVQPGEEDTTTNVFIGNLAPTMTEERVGNLFQQFGELYSVKIMWPRTQEEKARNRLTGFVCFMHRRDAENAMEACNETDPFNAGRRIMMRWGKSVIKQVDRPVNAESSPVAAASRPHLKPERHGQDSIRVVPPRDLRKDAASGRAELTPRELEEFHRLTRDELSLSREAICKAMVFCFEKSGATMQISAMLKDLLVENVPNMETRIARLYLVSDILFNSQQPGVRNAFLYRDAIERMAPEVFTQLGRAGRDGAVGRMTRNKLTTAVNTVLAAWTDWSVFASVDEMRARFEGRDVTVAKPASVSVQEQEEEQETQDEPEQAEPVEVIQRTPQGDWRTVVDNAGEVAMGNEEIIARSSADERIGNEGEPPAGTKWNGASVQYGQRKLPESDHDVNGEALEEGDDLDGEPLGEGDDVDGEPLDDGTDGSPLDENVDGEPLEDDPDGMPLDDGDLS